MKLVSAWPSKRNRTFVTLILERLPCAASTWKDAPASPRMVPTRKAPSSSKRTCFMGSLGSPAHELRHVLGKRSERMVAATDHRLQCAPVELHRFPVVEDVVARLHEEPIALG